MRAEKVVHALLQQDTGVAALLATRIYPGRIPQDSAMPCIAYELVSAVEVSPINAQAGGVLLRSRVQVNVLATTYAQLKAAHEAVRIALVYKSGLIEGVRVQAIVRELIGPDERDDELGLYMQGVDYLLTHDET